MTRNTRQRLGLLCEGFENKQYMVAGMKCSFWLNVQRRSDHWEAMHSPRERERIKRARPLTAAA